MQPHNPLLDTYRTLSGNVVELGRGLFPEFTFTNDGTPDYIRRAKNEWQFIPRQLNVIDDALTELGETVVQISFDGRLSAQAKVDDLASATASIKAKIDAATSDVSTRAARVLDIMKTAAYPARPGTPDAAQEARIAGIKADLRMVWDVLESDEEFVPAITESLRRSIGDGDDLQSWLIASTRWPEDYLRARGAEYRIRQLQSDLASTLDAHTPANLAEARRIYAVLADGRHGLPLLTVLFDHLDGIVDDLAAWRGAA